MLRVASCSYEGSLFGWDVPLDRSAVSGDSPCELKFGFNVTANSLKAVAVSSSGKYLATGGVNERISLFNVFENRGIGDVSGHSGSVTALKFFEDSMLLSASEDGTIYIWRAHDWEHLHILGGHKDSVLDFSIHPSGKVALSVSKDHTMKLWNLIQGRCAFTRRLRIPADQVQWHPKGSAYLLCASKEVQIFAAHDNSLIGSYTSSYRINSVDFMVINHKEDEYGIAYIDENYSLFILTMSGEVVKKVDFSTAAVGRLRNMAVSISDSDSLVTIVTSSGHMLITSFQRLSSRQSIEGSTLQDLLGDALVAHGNVKAEPRLTAVTSWIPKSNASKEKEPEKDANRGKKRSLDVHDDEEDNDEEELAPVKKVTFQPESSKKSEKNKKNKNKK